MLFIYKANHLHYKQIKKGKLCHNLKFNKLRDPTIPGLPESKLQPILQKFYIQIQ